MFLRQIYDEKHAQYAYPIGFQQRKLSLSTHLKARAGCPLSHEIRQC